MEGFMELTTVLGLQLRLTVGEVAAIAGLEATGTQLFGKAVDVEDVELLAVEGRRSLLARGLLSLTDTGTTVSPDLEPFVDLLVDPDGLICLTMVNSSGGRLATALLRDDVLVAVSPIVEGLAAFGLIARNQLDAMIEAWISEDQDDKHVHLDFSGAEGSHVERTWVRHEGALTCDGEPNVLSSTAPTHGLVLARADV